MNTADTPDMLDRLLANPMPIADAGFCERVKRELPAYQIRRESIFFAGAMAWLVIAGFTWTPSFVELGIHAVAGSAALLGETISQFVSQLLV